MHSGGGAGGGGGRGSSYGVSGEAGGGVAGRAGGGGDGGGGDGDELLGVRSASASQVQLQLLPPRAPEEHDENVRGHCGQRRGKQAHQTL